MAKRKIQDVSHVDSSPKKRVTRATASAAQPSVTANDASPPRKKRRGPQPNVENESIVVTPKPKRVYGRHNTKPADLSFRKENILSNNEKEEDSEADELNLGPGSTQDEDVPKKIRRRVIFDSVEIVTPRRPTGRPAPETSVPTSPTPLRSNKRSNLKKATEKPTPVPALSHTIDESVAPNPILTAKPTTVVPKQFPKSLPVHLHQCLDAQKRAILDAFNDPPLLDTPNADDDDEDEPPVNTTALQQLTDLLEGSIVRNEGNSCIVIGPAGSGKTKVFEHALSSKFEDYRPIIIRLNGHVQHSDRLAMREIARQVVQQTGSKTFESIDSEEDDNPFIDDVDDVTIGSLPPPSHLPSLIAALPTLHRPVVVLLDAFEQFTLQVPQALLYCLLDTVQSCRAGTYTQRGLAVVGLTTRIDVVNFLEKRVKSRFSHRMLRTAGMRRVDEWMALVKSCLCVNLKNVSPDIKSSVDEWRSIWEHSVNLFAEDRSSRDSLKGMFCISRDVRVLLRAVTNVVARLCPSSPYPTAAALQVGINSQRIKPQSILLSKLNYPSMSLLIATQHARTAGHDSFTFEMLHQLFITQVRTSSAAPVMLGGGGIGMVSVSRPVLMGAFEDLVRMKVFLQAAAPSANMAKEFVKYRCIVEREDVKSAVEHFGQTNLKKWFSKAQ
ncbi:origin recognition complex subunit 4 C-terminus-domain-containing protein [Phellopilus nigrolimitatus]|nr:origin recognition complex subunit 4 C-terminus-domain-containing protein [Phellopilus nigrolimitatus]